MSSPFLCGVLTAWCAGQLALGAFFVLAYSLRRREAEYLLFGLVCVTLALTTGGLAMAYGIGVLPDRLIAGQVANSGAIFSAALNLHFVMRYARVRRSGAIASVLYAVSGAFLLALWTNSWWEPGSFALRTSVILGYPVTHLAATPATLARAFYLVSFVEYAASVVLLHVAYRSGKREALSALGGALLVGLAIINDIGLILGKASNTLYLLPHAFLIYAFAVASTLLQRYRVTAGELEETISSLRHRTEQLRRSNAELQEVQDELVRKQQLAAVGELAAAIAHEVRNPLAVIVNAVSGLRREVLSQEDHRMLLDIVDEETARLNRLVTDLLRFARPVKVKRSPVSLVELCQQTQAVAREHHQIDVDIPDDPDLHTVWVDPGLFRLVLDNLVDNACQAMKGGGTVKIRVRRDDLNGIPCVRVDIIDRGHGMEVEVLDRATDPFFTTRPSGTGLGLPIVQRILKAHGGELILDSELGRGTTASLLVPSGEPVVVPAGGLKALAEEIS